MLVYFGNYSIFLNIWARNLYWRGRLSTIDLVELDELLWVIIYCLNEEVNRTEPSPLVGVPWFETLVSSQFQYGKIMTLKSHNTLLKQV
jgi:hypothetical protein